MKGEVEMQFSLSGLLLHTQPLHSLEQHTRAHLEFSSHFDIVCNCPLVHGFLLVVNKVGDQVVEAWFDEIIIVGLISSEAVEATEAGAL